MEHHDYSIVIPLYNEEECVGRCVQEILQVLEDFFARRYELILVINGSTDRTGAICHELARQHSQIRTVSAVKNLGYGGGILTGLAQARGVYCGFMCGDGQVDPHVLIRVMEVIGQGEYDLVKTRRVSRGDGVTRRFQSVVYNGLFRWLFGISCLDINAMPKIMRREVYDQLFLESTDWFIDAEIMIKAHHAKLRIKEIPIAYLKRAGGASVVRFSTIFEFVGNALKVLISGKFKRWKGMQMRLPETELAQANSSSNNG